MTPLSWLESQPLGLRLALKLLAAAVLIVILLVRAETALDFVYTGF